MIRPAQIMFIRPRDNRSSLNRLLFQRVRKSEHVHFSGLMGGSSSPITIIAHHHRHDYDDVEVEMH